MRFVFYFALECAPGREAPQDADAPAAHVVAVCRERVGEIARERWSGVEPLNITRRLLQFSHL